MITVHLTGQCSIFLVGIREIIASNEQFSITGISDLNRLPEKLSMQEHPDLVLADFTIDNRRIMPECRRLRRGFPNSRMLIFYTTLSPLTLRALVNEKVAGYATAQLEAAQLPIALHQLLRGQPYYCQTTRQLLYSGHQQKRSSCTALTKRETEVLQLIVNEYTTREIAEKLYISSCTAETHRLHIIQKLGVKNTAGIVREAMQQQLFVD